MSGTASEKLFGMAESLWEPDLPAEDLFETVSQTLLNAVDRDAYSGWGAVVWIIEKVSFLVTAVGPEVLDFWLRTESLPLGAESSRVPPLSHRPEQSLTHVSHSQDKVTKRWLKARMD